MVANQRMAGTMKIGCPLAPSTPSTMPGTAISSPSQPNARPLMICSPHVWRSSEAERRMESARREGFERVLSSVALGEVGIVGSRDASRLSRTDKDWCRLLEVCRIFGTLIADEQQIYD